jgi:hypothetical protein
MKAITNSLLALACVCLFFACSKSYDDTVDTSKQLKSKGTYSDPMRFEGNWGTDVYCDGVWIDYIHGSGVGQGVDHYVNGEWQWWNYNYKGTGTNLAGETFTFIEQGKMSEKKSPFVYTAHTIVKGDKGTLYNMQFILTFDEDWNWISTQLKNATCTGTTKIKD